MKTTYFIVQVAPKDCQSGVCLSGGKRKQAKETTKLCKDCCEEMRLGLEHQGDELVIVKEKENNL